MMKIYKAEQDLGLDFIAQADWSHLSLASALDSFKDTVEDKKKAPTLYPLQQVQDCTDLLQVNAILVTTNWNKNDDVFSPDEVWKAKDSPIFKPANVNHEGKETSEKNQIIGVIAACYAVNDEYKQLYDNPVKADDGEDDDEDEDESPVKFHLMISALLWQKYFPTAVSKITKQIDDGTMFVSMECIFPDFGYALRKADDPEGDIHLLPRNEITASLTQYLRAAKGPGVVVLNGIKYRIGRWLRNYVFSGVGFVERPGNPESIIFNDYFSAAGQYHYIDEESINNFHFDESAENCVLSFNKGNIILWPNH